MFIAWVGLVEKAVHPVCALVGHDFPTPTHHPPKPEHFDHECRRCGVAYSDV